MSRELTTSQTPACPYCGKAARHTTGAQLYPDWPKLANREFFACLPCGAWVGTHKTTGEPLGTLANGHLRALRGTAHAIFDAVWIGRAKELGEDKKRSRSLAYKWLARKLELEPDACHIGLFGFTECQRVITLCASRRPRGRNWKATLREMEPAPTSGPDDDLFEECDDDLGLEGLGWDGSVED